MNEILVAVDGSDHSFKVIDVANDLASKLAAEILLVYVVQQPAEEPIGIKDYEEAEQYHDAYADYLQNLDEKAMGKFSDVLKKAGIKFRAITPTGNPSCRDLEYYRVRETNDDCPGGEGVAWSCPIQIHG